MKRIKLLPENLINQIAAGEVIERPASAVKELVENSIDSGATKIEVEVSNGAKDLRIADNGSGIHKDDVALAFSRHATSKIENQKDLWSINTLGFRGEALASIISVAKVTCITRTANSENGLKVECANSEIKISETGCAVGTVMDVKDLFYNIPARLKFLKQPQTELSNITEVLQNIAISHPEVSVNLLHKKHSVIKTTGSSDLATVISEIYSKELIKELSEVAFEDTQFSLKIKGFVSNPDFTRSNKKAIYVFINGRTVKCPIISKAIDTVFKDLIPSGKYPFAVLNVTIPPDEIDVNVHPAKREVKYTKPNLIFNFVYSAIKSALEGVEVPNIIRHPELVSECSHLGVTSNEGQADKMLKLVQHDSPKIVNLSTFADLKDDEIIEYSVPAKKAEIEYFQSKIKLAPENSSDTRIEKHKIIGQFNNTYILIESEDGLQVVDQHIAHERYLYEKLKENKNIVSQLLLTSDLVEADAEQVVLLQENSDILSKYGFEIEFLQTGVKLKKVPQLLAEKNPEKVILDLIEAIQSTPDNMENEILETIACKAAVKAGERLSIWQMEELISNWAMTKFNKTCPHGRKISHIIPTKEIAKFFGRIE